MNTITIYRFTGKHGFFTIPKFLCEECDLSVASARRVAREVGENKVKVVVKSWFGKLFEVLPKGGWHAPVIMVNDQICVQGKVPDYKIFKQKILKLSN